MVSLSAMASSNLLAMRCNISGVVGTEYAEYIPEMESALEHEAATVIQKSWRRYRDNKVQAAFDAELEEDLARDRMEDMNDDLRAVMAKLERAKNECIGFVWDRVMDGSTKQEGLDAYRKMCLDMGDDNGLAASNLAKWIIMSEFDYATRVVRAT